MAALLSTSDRDPTTSAQRQPNLSVMYGPAALLSLVRHIVVIGTTGTLDEAALQQAFDACQAI